LEQQWCNIRQKTSEISTPRSSGAPGKRRAVTQNDPDSSDDFKEKMHSEGACSDDDLVDELLSSAPKIRLNPKARKVGRPKKQKQKTVATEKKIESGLTLLKPAGRLLAM
jgi:hypothetical protein